jgi:hypothetical protein
MFRRTSIASAGSGKSEESGPPGRGSTISILPGVRSGGATGRGTNSLDSCGSIYMSFCDEEHVRPALHGAVAVNLIKASFIEDSTCKCEKL